MMLFDDVTCNVSIGCIIRLNKVTRLPCEASAIPIDMSGITCEISSSFSSSSFFTSSSCFLGLVGFGCPGESGTVAETKQGESLSH
jgi:hypothetical protein